MPSAAKPIGVNAARLRLRESQVLCDGPELSQSGVSLAARGFERLIQAVIDVVMDQRLLGIHDRAFDRLQLLGDLDAGATLLDHPDDRLQMSVRPLEPLDDLWMIALVHWK